MASRRSHRAVAVIDGVIHPVLTIRENSVGKLILVPRRAKYAVIDGEKKRQKNQKYTLHTLSENKNNTIHHTLILENEQIIETHIVTSAIYNRKLELIFLYTLGDLQGFVPSQSVGPKDDHTVIAEYKSKNSVLHFAVFVGPPDADGHIIANSDSYKKFLIKFQNFCIVIVSCYSLCINDDVGSIKHFATAPVSFNRERSGGDLKASAGLNAQFASVYVLQQFIEAHCSIFMKAISKLSEGDPEEVYNTSLIMEPFLEKCFQLGLMREPFDS